MSYVYANEPKSSGKVILRTSAGELEIELWAKEAPKACRNFVQLCMEGYYDDTIFHRVVKGFIVQGGDPTGTGFGGESIYGKPFDDEFHSRLKFSHRGLLAMANSKPNSNQSQFFFTLAETPDLNGKNTIFGKVVGDTLFNLLKIGELETDGDEKPIYQAKVFEAKIVNNPFDDILPRSTKQQRLAEQSQKAPVQEKTKGVRSKTLLSFDNEGPVKNIKMKSSHDVINDPKLVPAPSGKQAETTIESKKRKVNSEQQQEQVSKKATPAAVTQSKE